MTEAGPLDAVPGPIGVAIGDQGIDGAADELRQVLAGRALVRVMDGDAMADGAFDGGETPDVVVITWGGAVDLGTTIALARRNAADAALVLVIPWYDELLFLSAIRLGAEDCLTASQIDGPALTRSLLLAVERHRISSTLRAAAVTDELTGLYNRRGYVLRAAALLKAANPKGIWQIFFDVDDLKRINDTYGHWAGDRALIDVAGVLRSAFRSSDIVARVGGDEFAVLAMAPADAVPSDSWAARWREPLAALSTRHEFPLSVSVGVAQPDEHRPMSPDDLLTRADSTMYTAKRLRKKMAEHALAQSPIGQSPIAQGVLPVARELR